MMMVVVVGSFCIGVPALAIFSLPIFLSILLGVSFKKDTQGQELVQNLTKSTSLLIQKTAA